MNSVYRIYHNEGHCVAQLRGWWREETTEQMSSGSASFPWQQPSPSALSHRAITRHGESHQHVHSHVPLCPTRTCPSTSAPSAPRLLPATRLGLTPPADTGLLSCSPASLFLRCGGCDGHSVTLTGINLHNIGCKPTAPFTVVYLPLLRS